jgi:thiol-disulfide isomerase/thioredoxin
VQPIPPGSPAPPIPGVDRVAGPSVVFFYKVTCPTCQVAAPVAERFAGALPGRFVGVGQDPREKLDQFAQEMATSFVAVPDEQPYELSNAYGVRTVPTLFVLDDGDVVDVVESWDREGWNRAAALVAERAGTGPVEPLSHEGDGLPPFRPG